ncbi:MAG: DNA repair protein RadA [Chloroflexota bacterium]
MAKSTSRFVCQTCGDSFLRWEGQCRSCAAWNSLVETVVREPSGRQRPRLMGDGPEAAPVALADIGEADVPRLPTGIGELDRVLGGGLVAGSLVLVGGEPGIGKSTLLLQVAAGLGQPVLYATGEESAAQVRLRAGRLALLDGGPGRLVEVLAEHDIGRIVEAARRMRPAAVVVDSIQTATVDELDGAAGSVGQVRESTVRLMDFAKGEGIAVILVGHVTKDGSIAGPKTLEHLVDAVVSVEGERYAALRLVRAAKNRFGSTEEVGVFEMAGHGLLEVADPARAFLADHPEPAPGSVIAPTLEGSRPLLVEVQALVAPAGYGTPARKASGLDPNRLGLLVAVLGRRAGIALGTHDVYTNLAGGLAVGEPGLDLPIALALASSLRDRPVRSDAVVIGEVGLLGELRPVTGLERRLREAARLGFGAAIVPSAGRGAAAPEIVGMRVHEVATLREAVEVALASPSDHRGDALPAMLG